MVLRNVRFNFLILLLIAIAPIFAQHKDAEWFEDDEVSTPSTTTRFGNRRTVSRTSTPQYIPRTTKYSLPPVFEVTTRSNRIPSRPTYPYTPADNLTDVIADLLKNFAKYTASNRPPSKEDGDEYFVDVLRFEILTIATGNHFVVPKTEDEKLERKQGETAWAAVQMWLDLFCTEDVDSILDKVVRETVVQYKSTRELLAVNKMHEILSTLLNKFNDTVEADDFLSSMYKAERIRYLIKHFHDADAQHKVYFSLDDVARGAVDRGSLGAWVNDPDIRRFLIHGAVLNMRKESGRQGSNEDDQNSVWVRTVLKVAREKCCIVKMQNVYTAALNETARNFDATASPRGTIQLFVDKVNESIEADSVLKNEWTKQKNDVGTRKITKGEKKSLK